jgi:hypothetical protein
MPKSLNRIVITLLIICQNVVTLPRPRCPQAVHQ